MRKLMYSKMGRVVEAFRIIKSLPYPKQNIDKSKGIKFERNLSDFIRKTIKVSFSEFINYKEKAEIMKKRAVV